MYLLKQTTAKRETKMTHTAKRINIGEYEYRGYIVTKQSYGWAISQNGFSSDATETLSEAKQLIDSWYN